MTTSLDVRNRLADALRLDLVGPGHDGPLASEVLPIPPTRWYLTGFLAPTAAPLHHRTDETAHEELATGGEGGGADDDETPEPQSGRRAPFPSSMGVSVLVPAAARSISVHVRWGEYTAEDATEAQRTEGAGSTVWRRTQRSSEVGVPIVEAGGAPAAVEVPGSRGTSGKRGLYIVTSVRRVRRAEGAAEDHDLPAGTRAVSVFLVNERDPRPDDRRDEGFVFQASLTLRLAEGFTARPNVRGLESDERDERIADLQYRDAVEYVVGHAVAAEAPVESDGRCREVRTTWIPSAEVEKVEPATIPDVELSMEVLAASPGADDLRTRVGALAARYGDWIEAQASKAPASGPRKQVADALLQRARVARDRISRGLDALADPLAFEAFRIANRTMARAARQRAAQQPGAGAPESFPAPRWRPFQLAFVLMNLAGIARPEDPERETVDLLFFPTGGGKTEAYLGLAAFTLVLRRLRSPGIGSAGVSVLMRYTLRLLTLDQLGRAATLICALELEREQDSAKLGKWPFEIGLWVGRAATPNRMGAKGEQDRGSARARTIAFRNDEKKPSPIPLENCPWCGAKFRPSSFVLVPDQDRPIDLRIVCASRTCAWNRERKLPIVAVDEPIYRRLPCFLIATVDKFASLPWVGRTGALFGLVERHDDAGFYGPCDPGVGNRLDGPLPPPDLVIQDELHLISGPLGTMVGLYETVIDELATRRSDGRAIRPKIVASTATVRRAEPQIQALFGRTEVEVFPPPGPDRTDSFFARTVPAEEKAARRYLGVAAQGRSQKVILLRVYLALLGAAAKADAARRPKEAAIPADPYMTVLGYFGSLRELGGSRRIVEDEVAARLGGYGRRKRLGEAEGIFADRRIREALELTSRVPTNEVAEAKRRLALPCTDAHAIDVALATNMISVGLDITRLGLMVVLGQPKTTAEYIQATSRVGRDDARPGLVVTLLNVHRPRDRSHYERFCAYHATFYRAVEATTVTPFSPRAVDRGLPAVAVSLARHKWRELTAPYSAQSVTDLRPRLDDVAALCGRRAERHDPSLDATASQELREKIQARTANLLDSWVKIAEETKEASSPLQYAEEVGQAPPLLRDPLDPELLRISRTAQKFKAGRSLRDVEPTVNVWLKRLDGLAVEEAEA